MTSQETNQQIVKVLDKYLSKEQQIAMFEELVEVHGNKSFKLSISYMFTLIRDGKK